MIKRLSRFFQRFCYDTADIYSADLKSSFDADYERTFIKSIACDVQPIGGGITGEEAGLYADAEMKMYCGEDDDIVEGNYAVIEGVSYMIVFVGRRKLGYCAYLKRRDVYGG